MSSKRFIRNHRFNIVQTIVGGQHSVCCWSSTARRQDICRHSDNQILVPYGTCGGGIILIPIWTEHSAVLLCHFDVYSMIISKLILAKFSLTSHLSYNRQSFGILLNNCLCIMVLISICHCLVRVCARARVCVRVSACECFCMPVLYAVCWTGVDVFVLLFHVIYSRTIASIANVFCWLYPTLNKVYFILLKLRSLI